MVGVECGKRQDQEAMVRFQLAVVEDEGQAELTPVGRRQCRRCKQLNIVKGWTKKRWWDA